jgi:ketosteroid isomerase-like protein
MSDPEQVARGLLGALQEAFAAHDLAAVTRLFDDEVVLFGTAAANLDRTQTDAYVARVIAQEGILRWGWDQVVPVLDEPGVLAFAVVGTVGFEDAQGQPVGERDAFRLTCVAVLRQGQWRLRHFHGSVPQQG